MTCESCGDKPKKCNKDFTKAVIEIDNPEQVTLMRKVVIPASMGDDTTVPPVVGKYHNVLLYYEANSKSYLYSSDGIPTQLVNGVTDYEAAVNLPQINGHTLLGNKTGDQLGLQDKLTAGDNITIENNVISATDTTYGPATDTEIGLVKPGDGLEVDANGTMSISEIEQYAHFFDTVADMKTATNLKAGDYARTGGFHTLNDGGGALYKITSTGAANEMDVIAIGDSLYTNLVMNGKITPEMYGAYGDGTHDDSTSIQRAFDTANVVDFLNKTYLCYALTCNYDSKKLIIHGNGATLKRPNLSVEPYNMTPAEMKWIQTIFVSTDCEIRDLNFDNNCFTMWQVSDGYTQEQACSVIVRNLSAIINFTIDNCYFKNSAGDGLHLAQNVNAQITNCKSTDCFRGGLTLTGYGCEINVDGWISETVTAGVHDGFDIEVDSSSSIYPTKFICNMNNIVLDYDLDIGVPPYGNVNINNLVMREYDTTTYNGYIFYVQGNLNITNSILRYGTGTDNTHIQVRGDGQMNMDSCYLYGTTSHAILDIQGNNANGNTKFNINNCTAICGTFIVVAFFNGFINVTNCNVKCSGKFIDRAGATSPHVKWLNVDNCTIDCSDPEACMRIEQTSSSFPVDVTLRLNNINCVGSCPAFLLCNGGHPKVIFGTLVFENAVQISTGYGGAPYFYGDKRIIVVDSADDLTFKGWVPGHDEAIIKGTNNRYRYTSGTTWTAI